MQWTSRLFLLSHFRSIKNVKLKVLEKRTKNLKFAFFFDIRLFVKNMKNIELDILPTFEKVTLLNFSMKKILLDSFQIRSTFFRGRISSPFYADSIDFIMILKIISKIFRIISLILSETRWDLLDPPTHFAYCFLNSEQSFTHQRPFL